MGLLNVKWTCLGDWDCLPGTVRLDQSHLPHQPPVFHRQSLGAYLIGKTLGLFSFFQGVELGGLHILTNPSVLEKNNDAISRMSRNCRFSEAFELAYLLFTAEGPNRTFPVGVATPNHVSSINNW